MIGRVSTIESIEDHALWDRWLDVAALLEDRTSPGIEDTQVTGHADPIPFSYRHVSFREKDGMLVVRFIDLKGNFESVHSLRELGQELEGLVDRFQACSLILDFECECFVFWDVFFAKLVRLHFKVKTGQGTVSLCNLPPEIVEILMKTRLIEVFPTYNCLDNALAGRHMLRREQTD
jgi:hypothetical protein